MRATGQTTTRRFVAAYALAGITFVAVLVPSFIAGLPGMLFLVPPLIAAYAVLFVLSRTPWFRDVVRRLTHGPYLIVSIALAAIVLLWANSLTGFHERLSAFNAGAPLTASLVLDVIAAGMLVGGAFVAAMTLTERQAPERSITWLFVAANSLLLVHTLVSAAIGGLPIGPHPLIPVVALALLVASHVLWMIRARTTAMRDTRR